MPRKACASSALIPLRCSRSSALAATHSIFYAETRLTWRATTPLHKRCRAPATWTCFVHDKRSVSGGSLRRSFADAHLDADQADPGHLQKLQTMAEALNIRLA